MRFTAPIQAGPRNPYVDPPVTVSEAFAPWARAGRNTVDGLLNDTSVRGTLVSMAGGGHRLYVNGGTRAAAKVEVGDTVTFELTARAAFDALPPSHRRELQRYIDDTRPAATRAKRIAAAAEHMLNPRRPAARQPIDRPLWTCPKCGNQFATRIQFHSCERHSLSEVFATRPPEMRALFDRLHEVVRSFGPVSLVCYHDSVAFMARVRFAGVVPRQRWLNLELWLPRRLGGPRFAKVGTLYPHTHIHTVRLHDSSDLDEELRGRLAEAYQVGAGKE